MSNKKKVFLAANSPSGFVSLFDELYNPYQKCRAYIIKGGPGTGKSSLMKKLGAAAEERGLEVIYVYCSSDPKSLDGVIIPEISLSVADGTAPHVLEPKFPGACESILNLGAFWNEKKLFENADKIRALSLENSLTHRQSTCFLSAAGALIEENVRILSPYILEEKVNGFARRFCAREKLKKRGSVPGRKINCFLSGITPEGTVFFDETIRALASRVLAIDDRFGAVSPILIEQIGEAAVQGGFDVIFCRRPMRPRECEHLIIPELSIAVATLGCGEKSELPISRTVRAKRFFAEDAVKLHRHRLLLNERLSKQLTDSAVEALSAAKRLHDELEGYYIQSMDFDALNEFSKKFIFSALGE